MKEMLNLSLRLMLICGVAALLLSQVDAFTRVPIAEAMRKARMEAIQAVLPAFDNSPDADKVSSNADGLEYYRGYRGEETTGVAFRALSQKGYSGEIEILVGVEPDGRVAGVRILRHAETPGLGAKYAEPKILSDFYAGRNLGDTDWRVVADGGDLDAVTGATVTGRAIGEAIARGLERYESERETILSSPRHAGEEVTP